jgi:purine-binding chemotaxis protein CheW
VKEEDSSLTVPDNNQEGIVKSYEDRVVSYGYSRELHRDLDEEEEVVGFLNFSLENEEYALNILNIKEIIKPKEITEIPKAPSHLLGIISLRGEIIPVIDLKRKLKLIPVSITETTRIIVIQYEENLVGILADSISQVLRIHKKDIQPSPSMINKVELEFIKGITRHNGKLIILLNIERIFNIDLFNRE